MALVTRRKRREREKFRGKAQPASPDTHYQNEAELGEERKQGAGARRRSSGEEEIAKKERQLFTFVKDLRRAVARRAENITKKCRMNEMQCESVIV